MVKQGNSGGGTVWWYSGTVSVEKWNSDGGIERWNSDGGTVPQCCWNSATVMVKQWNSDGGTMEQCWGDSVG